MARKWWDKEKWGPKGSKAPERKTGAESVLGSRDSGEWRDSTISWSVGNGRTGSLGYVPSKTRHAVERHWESSLPSLWGGYSSCVSCIEDTVEAMGLLRGFPTGKYEEFTFTT